MIPRVRWKSALERMPDVPFVLDLRLADITETVSAAVRNVPAACVAVSCAWLTQRHATAVEAAALDRGVRVIWVRGPYDPRGYHRPGFSRQCALTLTPSRS